MAASANNLSCLNPLPESCGKNNHHCRKQPLFFTRKGHLNRKIVITRHLQNSRRRLASVQVRLTDTSSASVSSGMQVQVSPLSKESTVNIRANSKDNPPIPPAVMTSLGPWPLDLMSVLLRSRIIFVGEYLTGPVAQRVISQLVTLATIDPDADILMYINCPGGTPYSVLAIFDCMQWIKPKVATVCIGIAVSHAALLLLGGEKGMRYSMPNSRIMIHQPQGAFKGHIHHVGAQVNEALALRDKFDKIYAALTGQPLEIIQGFTLRDRYFSAAEALDFGMIDGLMETEY
eukprot:TRINITY_DN3535_c0_g1_i1.p1 TRINITY_DN3535_c0_g1~~TRINITY_DN3535_c0_g1_i1.p1  ORF type:complete len:289 (-),score=28.81 TRINITY_DN3535_c0_g1_i1:287-1153(-)